MNRLTLSILAFTAVALVGCASTTKHDLAHYPCPDAQVELRKVLNNILRDAETANINGLREGHLDSAKFTKFGGGSFERINFDQCIKAETANVRSREALEMEAKGVKVDVFGNVAIVTCYLHIGFQHDGQPKRRIVRNTLAFLNTEDGWKIIHEHNTPKACFAE